MKITKALFIVLMALSLHGCGPVRCNNAASDDCLRILFVGNSYTYVNDLPNTFAKLARSGGHRAEVAMLAQGGWSLADHLASPEFSTTLTASPWDYVVLQEQSLIPAVKTSRTQSMYPSARALVRQIQANDATSVFFETWAYRDGSPEYGLANYEFMQYEVNQGYAAIAYELDVPLAPVGLTWFRALKENPSLELWQADGSHPAEAGTYLAACVFYAVFYSESPVGLDYRGNLSKEAALDLQEAAESLLVEP